MTHEFTEYPKEEQQEFLRRAAQLGHTWEWGDWVWNKPSQTLALCTSVKKHTEFADSSQTPPGTWVSFSDPYNTDDDVMLHPGWALAGHTERFDAWLPTLDQLIRHEKWSRYFDINDAPLRILVLAALRAMTEDVKDE